MQKSTVHAFLIFTFSFVLLSCTSKSQNPNPSTSGSEQVLIERGKTVYRTQCIACHNVNPHKAGSLGPDVFGSSKELLEARIVKGTYPQGYTPKRSTHLMAPLPHLRNEIDALHAYLNSKELTESK